MGMMEEDGLTIKVKMKPEEFKELAQKGEVILNLPKGHIHLMIEK